MKLPSEECRLKPSDSASESVSETFGQLTPDETKGEPSPPAVAALRWFYMRLHPDSRGLHGPTVGLPDASDIGLKNEKWIEPRKGELFAIVESLKAED